MMRQVPCSFALLACLLAAALALSGCAHTARQFPVRLGQEVACGGLTYRVAGCSWAHQFKTEGGRLAVPNHAFLVVRLEVTNSGRSNLPALWLPNLWLVDEHYESFPVDPVTAELPGALRGSPGVWRPTEKVSGLLVFDVPQAMYHLQPAGCPPLDLRCWWPERFGD